MRGGLLPVAGLGLWACTYSYQNPVELLPNGTIRGTLTTADGPAAGQVDLLWTDLSVALGAQGQFSFVGLPDGVYTVRYLVDAGAGAPPLLGYLRGISLATQPADQTGLGADAVSLGTITAAPAHRLRGAVTGLDGGEAVVAAFTSDDAGVATYEAFATTTVQGAFTLDLPPGLHQIWASTATASGMTLAGSSGSVAIALNFSDGGTTAGTLSGNLVIGAPGFGGRYANPAAVAALLGQGTDNNVEVTSADPTVNARLDPGGLLITNQIAGVGAAMNAPLPAGVLSDYFCGLRDGGPQDAGETLRDISLRRIPSIAGQVTNLGQITWLPLSTFLANAAAVPLDYVGSPAGTPADGG